ncbi:MAG: globin [Sandaracinus sp.]
MAPASYPVFENSLTRCLASPTFLKRFYARFMAAHPDIAQRFQHTDLDKQVRVLRASLYMMLRAAAGHEDGIAHLRDVGRTHGARNLDIHAALYDTWLDSLIAVAREVDTTFDDATEHAWRENLAPCITAILAT